ncbi:MAG: DUF1853 family protein [Halioglobus sp.]
MRDLAWACFSPPLLYIEQLVSTASGIATCPLQMTTARQQWLAALDCDDSALLEHLSRRPSHRLGVYFEQLWHFFLQHDPHTELIAHNLAIRDESRTLGEFDCLYYCTQRDTHIHLELAVKFYLGVASKDKETAGINAQDWWGPDRRDRLDTKLEQLLQRQILLGDLPAAQSKLSALNMGKVAREIALKGYLFWPGHATMHAPAGYNNACARNIWLRFDALAAHMATIDAQTALILPKMRWLSKVQCATAITRLSPSALVQQLAQDFSQDRYPRLIVALNRDGSELSRFFVTPNFWPERQH